MMFKSFAVLVLLALCTTLAAAQGKGIDQQNDRIRDAGSDRTPGVNGSKQDVGTGRGIDFGSGRTPPTALLPNPSRFAARRDMIIQSIQDVIRERNITLDTAASKLDQGILICQPYMFSKGAVVTGSELSRFVQTFDIESRGWTRGRYTLVFEVQPIDGSNTNVGVSARIEGRAESISGAEWITLQSNGAAEQEFLSELSAKLGASDTPPSR